MCVMCVCVTSRYACLCKSVFKMTVMLRVKPDDYPDIMFLLLLFDCRKRSAIINVN